MADKVTLVRRGFNEVRTSDAMAALLEKVTESLATRAGDGFEAKVVQKAGRGNRAHGYVTATTYEAARAESKDRALTRALAQET